jgi:glycosyltransferase involved in cell wall biosynthesis
MLSHIGEQKESRTVLEALNGLRELPWRLTIYGDCADSDGGPSSIPADLAHRVEWRHWPSSLEQPLSHCDLLCVPSRTEAFPLEIVEAMARRVPVVASAVCAVADVPAEGGGGVWVRDASLEGWHAALYRALHSTESWNNLGDSGFARMRASHTIEVMTDAYESAITAVL